MIVVQKQMVMSTQQDSVDQVGAAVVSGPLVDVVCFGPAGWSVVRGSVAICSAQICSVGSMKRVHRVGER